MNSPLFLRATLLTAFVLDACNEAPIGVNSRGDASEDVTAADQASNAVADAAPASDGMGDGGLYAFQGETGAPVAECSESASTNSGSIVVLVYSDGSGTRTVGPPNWGSPYVCPDGGCDSYYSPGSLTYLLEDLRAVGDLSNIRGAWCGKSASFGTTTKVTTNGKTSVDLQCMQNPTPAQCALYDDCLGLTGPVESSIGGGPRAACGFQ